MKKRSLGALFAILAGICVQPVVAEVPTAGKAAASRKLDGEEASQVAADSGTLLSADDSEPSNFERRLRQLEEANAAVIEQNQRLAAENRDLISRLSEQPLPSQSRLVSPFLAPTYDTTRGQFDLLVPRDPVRTPFALSADLTTEIRYTGFAASAPSWTDSAGTVQPIRDLNAINVQRNWLSFSGYAIDPRLRFLAVIFNSSTTNSTVFIGGTEYQFSEKFSLSLGYGKLPGSREWTESYRYTLGADRTMATTFFRPNMSPGIWASGEPIENVHYIAMLANSFDGTNLAANRLGTGMAFGGTVWCEPAGKFGPGLSDIEEHDQLTPRFGSSVAVSRDSLLPGVTIAANPEGTIFRLSNGTPLAETGALGPGTHVDRTSAQLWSLDAAIKYRGFSLGGEYYLRWLNNFRTSGGVPSVNGLFAHGGYLQGGYFLMPKILETYGRASYVTGQFAGGNEWSAGVNWYVRGTRHWRVTFDVTRINHSPADNILTGYRAGESGMLYQAQMLTDF